MEAKQSEFSYDRIEVCRNCKSDGRIWDMEEHRFTVCPVCCGSGLVKKHYEGTVTMEPYERD